MLTITDISAAYDGIRALQGVSLEVRNGEALAVLGANGAGKSTLLKVISGALPRTGGGIGLEDRSRAPWAAHPVARGGNFSVPAGPPLFPRPSRGRKPPNPGV